MYETVLLEQKAFGSCHDLVAVNVRLIRAGFGANVGAIGKVPVLNAPDVELGLSVIPSYRVAVPFAFVSAVGQAGR